MSLLTHVLLAVFLFVGASGVFAFTPVQPAAPIKAAIKPAQPKNLATAAVKIDTSKVVPAIRWGEARQLDGSAHGISAAFLGNDLLIVHKGRSNDKLYQNVCSNGQWLGETRIPNQSSQDYPAISNAGEVVAMVHTSGGDGGDHRMWIAYWTGEYWIDDVSMGKYYRSNRGPALAWDGKDLHLVYKDSESNKIYYDESLGVNKNGKSFGSVVNVPLTGMKSSKTATVSVYKGKVFIAYSGSNDSVWFSQGQDFAWNPPVMVAGIHGREPFLVSNNDKLFLFALSSDRKNLIYTTFDGKRWNATKQYTLAHPAHDIAVAIQDNQPHSFHLLYTGENNQKIYHVVGRSK